MQFSNTSKYAIRILTYMADNKDTKLINATQLEKTLQIPYKFLTKIMTELVKSGLINSIRGREGGYTFEKKISQITVEDILKIFNDDIKEEQCVLGIGLCNGQDKCALHDQWIDSKEVLQKMFRESSLESIAGQGTKS